MCWENWMSEYRRRKLDPYWSPCTKAKSKWIKDLNAKPWNTETSRKKWSGVLYNIGVRKDYLRRTPFAQELCLTIDKGPLKTKNLCTIKEIINRKVKPTKWESLQLCIWHIRLLSWIYKELKNRVKMYSLKMGLGSEQQVLEERNKNG